VEFRELLFPLASISKRSLRQYCTAEHSYSDRVKTVFRRRFSENQLELNPRDNMKSVAITLARPAVGRCQAPSEVLQALFSTSLEFRRTVK